MLYIFIKNNALTLKILKSYLHFGHHRKNTIFRIVVLLAFAGHSVAFPHK